MSVENTEGHWGAVSKSLHWIIALLIFAQIPLGLYADNQREAMIAAVDLTQIERIVAIFSLHKSIGLTIGVLMLIRLAWRLTHSVPPLSGELPVFMRIAARAAPWLFYVAVFALIGSGYVINEAARIRIDFYYLFEIPNFFYVGAEKRAIAEVIHLTAVWSISVLIILHVVASVFHHFVLKDDTMVKMLPAFMGGRGGPARPSAK